MPYRGIQLTPKPASEQPGDIFPIDIASGTVVQIRGTSVIQSWSVTFPGLLLGDVPPIPEPSDSFRWLVYWEERKMPGTNVSIVNIGISSTSAVLVEFSNGNLIELTDLAAMGLRADSVDVAQNVAQDILIAMAYRASPDGSNLGSMIGAQVAVNCAAGVADPVVYTAPA